MGWSVQTICIPQDRWILCNKTCLAANSLFLENLGSTPYSRRPIQTKGKVVIITDAASGSGLPSTKKPRQKKTLPYVCGKQNSPSALRPYSREAGAGIFRLCPCRDRRCRHCRRSGTRNRQQSPRVQRRSEFRRFNARRPKRLDANCQCI